MIVALLSDATVIRLLPPPSIMRLLGDRCRWAPRSAERLHARIGSTEFEIRTYADPAPEELTA